MMMKINIHFKQNCGFKCVNGGELDTESCICKCPAGKSGKYCEQACE